MFHLLSASLLMLMVLILGLTLKNPQHRRLWYVVLFLLCIGIQLLQSLLSMSDFYLSHPHWMHVGTWLLFANGPVTWLMLNNIQPSPKRLVLHLLPCLLALMYLLAFYQLAVDTKPQNYYGFGSRKMLFWLVFLLHWASYLLWSIKQNHQPSAFSSLVYLGCGGYLCGSLVTWLLIVFGGYYPSFWDMASLLSLVLMVAGLTCLFIINPKTSQQRNLSTTLPAKQLAAALHTLRKKNIHHQANLSLHQFAAATGFSQRQVSDYLNQYLQTNFKQWLNEQRIQDAVQLLFDQPAMGVTAIAYQVGFNSHATFYRAFKKHTGQSPGELRKSLKPIES